jgi:hypothetical protein
MLRRALLLTPFLLVGCASPRTSSVIVGDATWARASASSTEVLPVEAPAARAPSTESITVPSLESEEPSGSTLAVLSSVTTLSTATPPGPRHPERVTIKGGYYGSSEDGLDDGYIIDIAWMRFKSKSFATEFEIGYLDASGTDKGVDRDLWSIPIMMNGRFNVPVWKINVYGGLGLGSFYYEADAKTPGVKVSADGFLFGGDAFFGGDISIGKTLSLGLEAKYYLTDNVSELDGGLDAYVVMLTLGFGR